MKQINIQNQTALTGDCSVPGDGAISHRAVLFASIAEGESQINHFRNSNDCRVTISVMRGLGIQINEVSPAELVVHGRGLDGLQEPGDVLDCGNSATTIRLLIGLLAGQRFTSFVNGSNQIRRQHMGEFVRPLRMMRATISGRQDGGYAPLAITGTPLRSIEYTMPVANAGVKSCLLLAGMYTGGLTIIRQPGPSQDHTERLLGAMGAPIMTLGNMIHIERPETPLLPLALTIPSDFSLAAFLLVAALIVPGSRITVTGVGVNETRTGLLSALLEMGADIAYKNVRSLGGEPVADIEVRHSALRGITLGGPQIMTMLDELPLFAVAASQAQGRSIVRDASELRHQETDRIATTVSELRKMGVHIEPADDGFVIQGPSQLKGAPVESHGDPQMAMMLTVAGLLADGSTTVYGAEVTDDTFPGFERTLQILGAQLTVTNE